MSLRDILHDHAGAWPLDPVRPARRLRGHGAPFGRDEGDRCDPDHDNCLGTWSFDTSHLPAHGELAVDHAYDFGHGHRLDKGLLESIRVSRLQSPAVEPSYETYGDEGNALSELFHRHETAVEHSWLVYNCRLSHVGRDDVVGPAEGLTPDFWDGKEFRPQDFDERTLEIGEMLAAEDYDIAALCELFRIPPGIVNKHASTPDKKLRAQADVREFVRGPGLDFEPFHGDFDLQDSGLEVDCLEATDGPSASIGRVRMNAFDSTSGSDNKGWLYAEIDLGPGAIDLFLSHTDGSLDHIEEIVSAVQAHSVPSNPTMLVGDLNIDDSTDKFATMLTRLGSVGLQDAWFSYGGIEGPTEIGPNTLVDVDDLKGCHDHTTDDACDDYAVDDAEKTTRGGRYSHTDEANRIDFVFVESPHRRHGINLDISRIRRRAFPRTQTGFGPGDEEGFDFDGRDFMHYLSDHMGLSFRTVVSPKRNVPPIDPLTVSLHDVTVSKGTRSISEVEFPAVVVEGTVHCRNGGDQLCPELQVSPRVESIRFDTSSLSGVPNESSDTLHLSSAMPRYSLRHTNVGARSQAGDAEPEQRVRTTIQVAIPIHLFEGGEAEYTASVTGDDPPLEASAVPDREFDASTWNTDGSASSQESGDDGSGSGDGEEPVDSLSATELRDHIVKHWESISLKTVTSSIRGASRSDTFDVTSNRAKNP